MLVILAAHRRDDRAIVPVDFDAFACVREPEQRVAGAADDDDLGARPMAVGFFVGAGRELADVQVHGVARHPEKQQLAGATLPPLVQGDRPHVRQEVRLPLARIDLPWRIREVVVAPVIAVGKTVVAVEDEIGVADGVHQQRSGRRCEQASRPLAIVIEVLIGAVDRDGEEAALLPLDRVLVL